MDFLNNLNISQNQLLNAALHNFALAPEQEIASPKAGLIGIYNGTVYYYTGTGWVTLALGGVVSSLKNTVENIQKYFAEDTDEADKKINKWNEIVDFLNATEGDTLDSLLATKADAQTVTDLSASLTDLQNTVAGLGEITFQATGKSLDKGYDPNVTKTLSLNFAGSGAINVAGAYDTTTNKNTFTFSLSMATASALGGVMPMFTTELEATTGVSVVGTNVGVNAESSVSGRYYGVSMDKNGKLFVNVPWTDSSTTSLAWSAITDKPTTLAGYGITDAKIANGVITLGDATITPLVASSMQALIIQVGSERALAYTPTTGATLKFSEGNGIALTTNNNGVISIANTYSYTLTAAAIKAADTTLTRKFVGTITPLDDIVSYDVEHKLGTYDVVVAIYDPDDDSLVMTDVSASSDDIVELRFATKPEKSYRVVVIG